ncbi:hypothetical protein VZT92_023775 [Zoarces viviparus]|uniref:Uncharacterized protein n=1 Tax=Zoarces viviparus TaxID=48416 RepID=A0AAW1E9M0_ZOAVI
MAGFDFSSRGERGETDGEAAVRTSSRAAHAAKGCSACHSAQGCLDKSRELGEKQAGHLLILPLTACWHGTASTGPARYEGDLVHPRCRLRRPPDLL